MDGADDRSSGIERRRLRQRAEILGLLAAQLHRAADLAHEHLAEFTDDEDVRAGIAEALHADPDPQLRRRADEFRAG